ncbi:MAG: ATP-binding protein [Bacteroidales bacterium]|nr:ATP-binding protein [Bacteroidales bacterium]
MKRKIYNELLKWKNEWNGRTAILIDGARRVGKSYIVEEFAKKEYKSFILIDFSKENRQINALFTDYLSDSDTLFRQLSLLTDVKLYPRQSAIVFDEVQQFPPARAAIKHLVKDGRFDYIETGSLVSINRNVKNIVIPSEEERIDMFPMDFEEFLWAIGKDDLMDYVRECFEAKRPLGAALHHKTMELFRQYMIVGGMPQAVEIYAKEKDFDRVDHIKRNILKIYRADISKYATGYEQKVTRIFDAIPSQLQKHEKRFRIGALEKGARTRDYANAFFWLEESRVVNVCYAATEPNIGLYLNRDDARMKLYMADTGLLIAMAFSEKDIHQGQLYKKLMFDKLEVNKGMLVENIVAQMLRSTGNELYFYSNPSRTAEDRMEIDFLIRKPSVTSRHNISPIEVKSSTRYTLSSLEKCICKYGEYLSTPYVLHSSDLMEKDGITYLPLYMALCL